MSYSLPIANLSQIALDAISNRVFPGCVIGLILPDGNQELLPFGSTMYESGTEVSSSTIYDLASITKSIPTSSLALQLVEQGKIELGDHVTNYIPELKGKYKNEILIKHLLTFTVTFAYPGEKFRFSDFKDLHPDEMLQRIFEVDLAETPGSYFQYTNPTAILLGLVVERVSGKRLNVLAQEEFFDPLGMTDTGFNVSGIAKDRIAPTEIDEWRGRLIHGEVHDESAYALSKKYIPAHAGLFSTVPDLLRFVRMILQNGEYNGKRFFTKETVTAMGSNQISHLNPVEAGLGWERGAESFMGPFAKTRAFAKTGFTGCMVLCDVEHGIGFVMLSNRVHPKRPINNDSINQVRCALLNEIYTQFVS